MVITKKDFESARFATHPRGWSAYKEGSQKLGDKPIETFWVTIESGEELTGTMLASGGWVPVQEERTITKTEFDHAFDSTLGTTTPAVCIEMLRMYGIDVVHDPEPDPDEVRRLADALNEASKTLWREWEDFARTAIKLGVKVTEINE